MTPERPDGDGLDIVPQEWFIYRGTGQPLSDGSLRTALPSPPPWRNFDGGPLQQPPAEDLDELARRLGPADPARTRRAINHDEVVAVNAALFLRRPLLVSGPPGVGKSTLAYQISRELRLGPVLRWPINSRVTLRSGMYDYDAIARVHEARRREATQGSTAETDIGDYVQLGPLGTALLPYELPRMLLIDEFDKSDPDLANDLLDVLEEGAYEITELARIRAQHPEVRVHTADPGRDAVIHGGSLRCRAFPFIVITSNGEREFPPAFLRRCVRLEMPEPTPERLADLITAHFSGTAEPYMQELIQEFLNYRRWQTMAADQLLNVLYLAMQKPEERFDPGDRSWRQVMDTVLQRLDAAGPV
ncbi:AAA family ATPase [Nonomuraea typhae]|uniref:AAA family ATPase n=1 Tax=Nonomuraea typhae TaxID=2603600 RepID=UPI0012FBC0B5|nr:MoxR family ATPase [Nonomuraea typhae]